MSIFDFLLPTPTPYPSTTTASGTTVTATTPPAPAPGLLDRIFSFLVPSPIPYPAWPPTVATSSPAPAVAATSAPSVTTPAAVTTPPATVTTPATPSAAPAAPSPSAPPAASPATSLAASAPVTPAVTLPDPAASSPAMPAFDLEAPAAASAPPSEPARNAPCTVVRRAFSLSPAFVVRDHRRGKSEGDTDDAIHHSAPIPFLVPAGCETVEFSTGRIERTPESGDECADAAAVTIEGVKLTTNGPDVTALRAGDQVTVAVAWRAPSRLTLPEGALRVMVYAHFRPTET